MGETKDQFVPLEKELQYLDSFVELQRERLDNVTELPCVNTGSPDPKLKIASLIRIPFVENAFKHGVNPEEAFAFITSILKRGKQPRVGCKQQEIGPKPGTPINPFVPNPN
ncbi:hypothetical protein MKJ04_00970 [Pontibacter sp. E15-1]|nr:hypothetical protein [Pontibacter sp. E15-1]MCJ8163394.1 hypothetical protein [Pontibacter sp. E15-1]